MAVTTYKKKRVRKKLQYKAHARALEDKPYQLDCFIKVMVTKVHSVFSHALVGHFIQIVGEGDGVLFGKCDHRFAKVGRVEVPHISDRSVLLVEGF